MNLFAPDPSLNLLPRDGEVVYHGPVLSPSEASRCFDSLKAEVPWRNDEVVIFGKRFVTARKVAWYGDDAFAYTYSGTTRHALPWTAELLRLKAKVELIAGTTFNSCLINLYQHGEEGMSWHSDDEPTLVRGATIASMSLGAERKFAFKHKREPGLTASIMLEHGSLLLMKGATQEHWLHALPKTKRVTTPRINLTFRVMVR